jgi:hypothetical protein
MLKSYAAIYKQGHLNWLDDVPQQENVQVIVTFTETAPKKQLTQAQKILQQAWGCIKQPYTIAQIDADIAQMRSEWE